MVPSFSVASDVAKRTHSTHTHTHNGISLDHKKETLPVVTIHLEDITLSEISQTERQT